MGGEELDRISPHAKTTALKGQIIARILKLNNLLHQCALVNFLTPREIYRHFRIGFHRADTVNARDRGDDDTIITF